MILLSEIFMTLLSESVNVDDFIDYTMLHHDAATGDNNNRMKSYEFVVRTATYLSSTQRTHW